MVLSVSATGSGARLAAGSGALVSGTATITTGLTSILGFSIDNTSQPTGTGVASAQILQASWTTGAVTVTAFSISSVTGATIAASGSSGSFTWVAIGL